MPRHGPRVRMELLGLKEMQRTLQTLPDALQHSLVTEAMVDAAQPMAAAARAAAPDQDPIGKGIVDHMFVSDKLTESQAAEEPAPRRDEIKVYVGTNRPEATLNEFGTGPRRQQKTGKYVGEMPARPFLRPAFDSTARGVIVAFAAKLKVIVEAAAKRLARTA